MPSHTTHDSLPASWLEAFKVPNGWVNVSSTLENELCLCQIVHQQAIDCAPIVVSRSLIVKRQHFSWMLHVHGHHVNLTAVSLLSRIPSYLESETATALLESIGSLSTCIGNPEDKFTQLGKAKKNRQFLSGNGSVVAYLDVGFVLCTNAKEQFSCTVRHTDCHLLTAAEGKRCESCLLYRNSLFSQCSRIGKSIQTHKKTNYR